jgi:hypothetical protein
VPAVYEAHGTDLVMERLEGPTMLSALVAGDLGLIEAAALLADLHGRLHMAGPAAALLTEFLCRAGGDPLSALDRAVTIRRANPTLTAAEVDRLTAAAALVVACGRAA